MIDSSKKRRKRFQRDPKVSLKLTDRDRQIIHWVYRHRFLSSKHIISLVGGSAQGILRRLKGKTPNEFTQSYGFEPGTLGPNTKLPDLVEIPDGNIILIRFIRSDRMLDVFGEKFKVSKNMVYSYVKAVIVTEIHQLQLYLGDELAETFDYQLPV